ncbi:hypothetical protein [Paraglaciecola sp.]|uniref:hypothetical protein n=1 Tax=Paraglaciecola sp. TaxID=1920173 RepID=UPI003EF38B98
MNDNFFGKMMAKICNGNSLVLFVAIGITFNGMALGQVKSIDKNASPLETEVNVISTDNLNPTVSEKSNALGVSLKASGQLVTSGEGNLFMLNYGAQLERYNLNDLAVLLSNEQDFSSYRSAFLGRLFISEAWYVDTELEHSKEDEKFGFGLSNLRNDVLLSDERTENKASINLLYGNDTANRAISFKLSSSDVKYANINSYSSLFNYKEQTFDLNIAFKQSSITRWLLSFEATNDDYDSDLRDDSRLYRLLLGVDWRPSGKSKFKVLFGAYRREPDNDEARTDLSWAINYYYQARQDLLFTFNSYRLSAVGRSEFSSESVDSSLAADLSYLYSDQWKIGANLALDRSEYDEALVAQVLDEKIGRVRLTLILNQHSQVWFDAIVRQVSSRDDSTDYQQNEVKLSWSYAF